CENNTLSGFTQTWNCNVEPPGGRGVLAVIRLIRFATVGWGASTKPVSESVKTIEPAAVAETVNVERSIEAWVGVLGRIGLEVPAAKGNEEPLTTVLVVIPPNRGFKSGFVLGKTGTTT